jgi:HTH-type transcriptional regulator/antitoxin HigA
MLRERGVIVVFEDHLPRTHLDGAALLLENNVPVIGMTLRYNRLDNFWFVLLHEIAHIIRHRKKLEEGFFDDMDAKDDGGDIVEEREADEYALEWLIPGEVWRASLVRFTTSRDAIIQFASRQGVSPAIVAGRIRRERAKQGGYRLFADLVGEGAVRPLLQQAGYVEG